MRVLTTGYCSRNISTDMADAVTQSSADCVTEYWCASTGKTKLDQD